MSAPNIFGLLGGKYPLSLTQAAAEAVARE